MSDYTPLSLAASGGYTNIIKLLLAHGAEINSRTGSKLGISPLMLAAMNGHTAAVKLLLDMGSDINAQIETNRNTALTLACFQGRHEVVNIGICVIFFIIVTVMAMTVTTTTTMITPSPRSCLCSWTARPMWSTGPRPASPLSWRLPAVVTPRWGHRSSHPLGNTNHHGLTHR